MNEPRCKECGFSLRGHAGGATVPRCPECGATFDPQAPWTPEPLPTASTAARLLSVPLLVTLVIFLLVGTTSIGRNLLIWWAIPFWITAIATLGFLWPVGWAYEMARERAPSRDQKTVVARWLTPTLLFNAAATIAALIAYFAML